MKPKIFFFIAFVLFALLVGCAPIKSSSTPETDLPSPAAKATQTPTPAGRVPTTDSTRTAVVLSTTPPKSPPPFKTAVPVVLSLDYFSARTARENTPVPVPSDPITVESASRIDALARWGKGNANAAAYSPDGSMLAVASSLGIYIYQDQQTLLKTIETEDAVTALIFSPDGNLIVAGLSNGQIQFWQWQENRLFAAIPTHLPDIVQLAYLNNGTQMAVLGGPERTTLEVWNIEEQKILFQEDDFASAQFFPIPDDQSIFGYTPEGLMKFSISNGEKQKIDECVSRQYDGCWNAAVAPNGKTNFVTDYEQRAALRLISAEQAYATIDIDGRSNTFLYFREKCDRHLDGPGSPVIQTTAFSPDGSLLAIGINDDSVRMVRVSDGGVLYSTPRRTAANEVEYRIKQIIFSPDQTRFTVLYENGMMDTRDTQSGKLLVSISGHTAYFRDPAFFPDGKSLAAAASDNLVRIWSLPQGQRSTDLEVAADTIVLSPDGEYLVAGGRDWNIYVWNMNTGVLYTQPAGHTDRIWSLSFLGADQTLISGSRDCSLKTWTINDGISSSSRFSSLFSQLDGMPMEIQTDKSGQWFVVNRDTGAGLYYLEDQFTENPVWKDSISLNGQSSVFSPDGQFLVDVNTNSLTFWQLDPVKMLRQVSFPGEVYGNQNGFWDFLSQGALTYSPDGLLVAVGDIYGNIHLVDASAGKLLVTFHAHRGTVTGLAFSPDGQWLSSSSEDGTIRIWGVAP